MTLEVVEVGAGATVQDLGRTGHAAWGVGGGGAADRAGFRLAQRLVGTAEDAAAFEVLFGGFGLRTTTGAWVAVTGAPVPVAVGERVGRFDGPQWVPAGATLRLGRPSAGLRIYVAVRGGLDTEVVLGSRSVDEASGMGRAVRAGDRFEVGRAVVGPLLVDLAAVRRADPTVLTGVLGPRDEWFTAAALEAFGTSEFTVEPESDRVGVRLSGPSLDRAVRRELLSEPTIRGAVEVPADGRPIVFGADHPTTCGYPVIAVLDPESVDALAQCRPGEVVRFRVRRAVVRIGGT
ncbi:5-oxoprolinase subunit C family protein [Jatrophihabitans sp. YIM 134969]